MTKFQSILVGAAAGAAAIAMTAAAQAGTTTIVPSYPGTVTGSYTFTGPGTEIFKFTVKSPYTFDFILGAGAFTTETDGPAGTYSFKEKATSAGTVSYSLTTSVPEPAAWAMMLVGFGGVGAAMRRRGLKTAAV